MSSYLDQITPLFTERYLVLATSSLQRIPRATPLYFAPTADGNRLYWRSAKEAIHSRNVAENPIAHVTIANFNAPQGTGIGLYGEGYVSPLVNADEIAAAISLLLKKNDGVWWEARKDPHYYLNPASPESLYAFDLITRAWSINTVKEVPNHPGVFTNHTEMLNPSK